MPEGDTVHGIAIRVRERIAGRTIRRVGGSAVAVRRHAHGLAGVRVKTVETVGKYLLIEFDGGWTLHVHLGMTGRWRFGPPTGRRGDGPCRVALETAHLGSAVLRRTLGRSGPLTQDLEDRRRPRTRLWPRESATYTATRCSSSPEYIPTPRWEVWTRSNSELPFVGRFGSCA